MYNEDKNGISAMFKISSGYYSLEVRYLWYADNNINTPNGGGAGLPATTMSRAKSAVVFSGSDPAARRARMGRSMSLAPVRERRRSAMGEYIGERPLSAACTRHAHCLALCTMHYICTFSLRILSYRSPHAWPGRLPPSGEAIAT